MKKTQTTAFSNLIGSILFIALGIWGWVQTYSFRESPSAAVQPSGFPRIMIAGLLIFAVILLIQSVYKLATMKMDDPLVERAESIDFIHDRSIQAALMVIALCIFFVALFRPLGYIICGAVVSVAIMFLIGKRKWVQMILISVLVPLGMWLIFYKMLAVRIPLGPLSFLQTLVDLI